MRSLFVRLAGRDPRSSRPPSPWPPAIADLDLRRRQPADGAGIASLLQHGLADVVAIELSTLGQRRASTQARSAGGPPHPDRHRHRHRRQAVAVHVHGADNPDRDGGKGVLKRSRARYPFVTHAYADGGTRVASSNGRRTRPTSSWRSIARNDGQGLRGSAETLGGGADIRLDHEEPPLRPRLQAAHRRRRDPHGLCNPDQALAMTESGLLKHALRLSCRGKTSL